MKTVSKDPQGFILRREGSEKVQVVLYVRSHAIVRRVINEELLNVQEKL